MTDLLTYLAFGLALFGIPAVIARLVVRKGIY